MPKPYKSYHSTLYKPDPAGGDSSTSPDSEKRPARQHYPWTFLFRIWGQYTVYAMFEVTTETLRFIKLIRLGVNIVLTVSGPCFAAILAFPN